MTNRQKRLVQDSFSRIAPAADTAASLFLTRLREVDPQFRDVAPGDVPEQAHKLIDIVAMTVKGLDRFEELVPDLEQFWFARRLVPHNRRRVRSRRQRDDVDARDPSRPGVQLRRTGSLVCGVSPGLFRDAKRKQGRGASRYHLGRRGIRIPGRTPH